MLSSFPFWKVALLLLAGTATHLPAQPLRKDRAEHPLNSASTNAPPGVTVDNLQVRTQLDPFYMDALLRVEVRLHLSPGTSACDCEVEGLLFDPAGKEIRLDGFRTRVSLSGSSESRVALAANVKNPRKWTAETPWLYSLAVRVHNAGTTIHEFTSVVGFRQVEVVGMTLRVNGVPIELRGVEVSQLHLKESGESRRDALHKEFRLLKEANVNSLRTRELPLADDILQGCDLHGVYVIPEVPVPLSQDGNVDSLEEELAGPSREIFDHYQNHPSVILWHVAHTPSPVHPPLKGKRVAHWLALHDPSRPLAIWNQEGWSKDFKNAVTDLHGDPMSHVEFKEIYPTPVLVSAFHPMPDEDIAIRGQGLSETWGKSLQQAWDRVRARSYFVAGGFLCCWDDEPTADGGSVKHQGFITPEQQPRPAYSYLRKAYAPVLLSLQNPKVSRGRLSATLEISNKFSFINLDGFVFQWELSREARKLAAGHTQYQVFPRSTSFFSLILNASEDPDQLYFSISDPEGHRLAEYHFSLSAEQVLSSVEGQKKNSSRRGNLVWLEGKRFSMAIDAWHGLPRKLDTHGEEGRRIWLQDTTNLTVRDEATNTAESLTEISVRHLPGKMSIAGKLKALALDVTQDWAVTPSGLSWELEFSGTGKRAGHEVILEFPVLSESSQVFTPSNRGLMEIAAYPSFVHAPYASQGLSWEISHAYYVLPLVSVFDVKTDSALTLALPADEPIPNLQISWSKSRVLRLRLAHRGMGGNQPSRLKLLVYTHPCDYRNVLKAYSDDFPRYFRPTLPRDSYEGAFFYHPIHDHPPMEEMARQQVRYIWTFPWFTHVGEYLPDETEWIPYSYSNWWRLGELMNDEKIRTFIKTMQSRGVGVYGHMCLNEFGGPGSYAGIEERGDSPRIEQIRNSLFPAAVVKDEHLQDIVSWEGCKVMNPDRRYGFFSYLLDQLERQLRRLPEINGFIIDRLDWSSIYDFGHEDGLTMIAEKPIASMAVPMAQIVQEFCRVNHEAGKRVFVNHAYRIEILRDVDGYCYEMEFLPALSYLAPLRPVSSWNSRKNYHGDLLQFEAQLKKRLQCAVFPHMVSHEFPICQQPPDRRAADLLEIYAPLFSPLHGKELVLLPHCVSASGANDVNLYTNGDNHYVVPVTSRVRFLSRRVQQTESVKITVNVPDGRQLQWAHVYSADGPVYKAPLNRKDSAVQVEITKHGSSSMVVLGKGTEPALKDPDASRLSQLRDALFPPPMPGATRDTGDADPDPSLTTAKEIYLRVEGTQVGEWGAASIQCDGHEIGQISSALGNFSVTSLRERLRRASPQVSILTPDEGMWFVPQYLELLVTSPHGETSRIAFWTPEDLASRGSRAGEIRLPLHWCRKEVSPSQPDH
ncbi:MAG: glycoside hydrolase family 2 TIM barrel-domain containing protein [Terriglobia bacterium]